MPGQSFIARSFFMGGGILAVLGFILWFALPIKSTFPPFLLTALLAMIYGMVCLKRQPKADDKRTKA